jgi:cell division protease FtsH
MTLNVQHKSRVKMVTEYGMSEETRYQLQFSSSGSGQVFLGKDMQGEPEYSGQIAYEIDKEVQRIVKEQYARAKEILLEHKSQLELIAKTLLTEETLVAEQIKSLFNDGVLPEVNYDDAKVANKEDSDFQEGKYGKSYDDIRKEQHELTNNENQDIDDSSDSEQRGSDDQGQSDEQTGHEQAPNIDKPSNPSDPNDPSNRN